MNFNRSDVPHLSSKAKESVARITFWLMILPILAHNRVTVSREAISIAINFSNSTQSILFHFLSNLLHN